MEDRSQNSLWYQRRIDRLFAIWWVTDIVLFIVVMIYKVNTSYFILFILSAGLIHHLVKKYLSSKALAIFYVSAIAVSIAMMAWVATTKEMRL